MKFLRRLLGQETLIERTAREMFTGAGDRRRRREIRRRDKFISRLLALPHIKQLVGEIGLTERHLLTLYDLMNCINHTYLIGDKGLARNALSDEGLLRWYCQNVDEDMGLNEGQCMNLIYYAKNGRFYDGSSN